MLGYMAYTIHSFLFLSISFVLLLQDSSRFLFVGDKMLCKQGSLHMLNRIFRMPICIILLSLFPVVRCELVETVSSLREGGFVLSSLFRSRSWDVCVKAQCIHKRRAVLCPNHIYLMFIFE